MTEKEVIREVLALRHWSQATLAQEAGFKSQSNITGLLNVNQKGIRIDNLIRIFRAMGCEIVVRDKMGSKKEWVIDDAPAESEKSIEERLKDGEMTFAEAIKQGWTPSPEMLDKMLNS